MSIYLEKAFSNFASETYDNVWVYCESAQPFGFCLATSGEWGPVGMRKHCVKL